MENYWRTVSIFISSTFKDMHSERDVLVKQVFPTLREKLLPHRIKLIDIDLRWGITGEQAENNETIDFCLKSIDDCRPFFLGLLGERYGWIPDEQYISSHSNFPENISITAMEIIHGVLSNNSDEEKQSGVKKLLTGMRGKSSNHIKDNALFLFRDNAFEKDMPNELADLVIAESDDHKTKQIGLKEKIRNYPLKVSPIDNYKCNFSGLTIDWELLEEEAPDFVKAELNEFVKDGIIFIDEYNKLTDKVKQWVITNGRIYLTDLEEFGKQIEENLWELFCVEFPELKEETKIVDAEDLEDAEHERFLNELNSLFVGRENEVKQIEKVLYGEDENSNKPIIVTGSAGSGKSALLAEVITKWEKRNSEDILLYHFAGASNTGDKQELIYLRLLKQLCAELNIPFQTGNENGYYALQLQNTLNIIPENKSVLIAIDELDTVGETIDLRWLPEELPKNVKIVLSYSENLKNSELNLQQLSAFNPLFIRLPLLNKDERKEIIKKLPALSAKTMDKKHTEMLSDIPGSNLPLYLVIALEELRRYGSYEGLEKRIKKFPDSTGHEGLITVYNQLLSRLEKELGTENVKMPLCLLAISKTGLKESEVATLCNSIPQTKLATLWRELRIHLNQINDGFKFYHNSLKIAITERYLSDAETKSLAHIKLIELFKDHKNRERALTELLTHYYETNNSDKLKNILSDLQNFLILRNTAPGQILYWWEKAGVDKPLVELHKSLPEQLNQYENVFINDEELQLGYWSPKFANDEINIEQLADIKSNPILNEWQQDVLLELVRFAESLGLGDYTTKLIELKILTIFEKEYGPVHPRTLEVLGYAVVHLYNFIDPSHIQSFINKLMVVKVHFLAGNHPASLIILSRVNRILSLYEAYNPLEFFKNIRTAFLSNEENPNMIVVEKDLQSYNYQKNLIFASELDQLSQRLRVAGEINKAHEILIEAKDFSDKNLGTTHETSIMISNNLAWLLVDNLDEKNSGEQLFEETLRKSELLLGKNSKSGLALLNNYACHLGNTNRFEEGLPYYEEVVNRKINVLGKNNPSTLSSINNLSYCLNQLGENEKSISLKREIVSGYEQLGEKYFGDKVFYQIEVCCLLNDMNEKEQSDKEFQEIFNEYERKEQKDLKAYNSLNNYLATELIEEHRYEEALPILTDMLNLYAKDQSAYPYMQPTFNQLIGSLKRLVDIYITNNESEKTINTVEKIISLYEKYFGEDDLNTLNWKVKLAEQLKLDSKDKEAELLLIPVVEKYKELKGESDPETRIAISTLASVMEDKEEAGKLLMNSIEAGASRKTDKESMLIREVKKVEHELGKDHFKTLEFYDYAVEELLKFGNHELALEYSTEVYKRSETSLGVLAPETISRLRLLAKTYMSIGDNENAVLYLRRVVEAMGKAFGDDSKENTIALDELSNALIQIGEHAEAIKTLEKNCSLKNVVYNKSNLETLQSEALLLLLYENNKEDVKSTNLFKKIITELIELTKEEEVKNLIDRYISSAEEKRKTRIENGVKVINMQKAEGKLSFINSEERMESAADSMTQAELDPLRPEGSEELFKLMEIFRRLTPNEDVVKMWEEFIEHYENIVFSDSPIFIIPRWEMAQWVFKHGVVHNAKQYLLEVLNKIESLNELTNNVTFALFNLLGDQQAPNNLNELGNSFIGKTISSFGENAPKTHYIKIAFARLLIQCDEYKEAGFIYKGILEEIDTDNVPEYFLNQLRIEYAFALALSGDISGGLENCNPAWQYYKDEPNHYSYLTVCAINLFVHSINKDEQNVEFFKNNLDESLGRYLNYIHKSIGSIEMAGIIEIEFSLLCLAKSTQAAGLIDDLNNTLSVGALMSKSINHYNTMNDLLWKKLGIVHQLEDQDPNFNFVVEMWKETNQKEMIKQLEDLMGE